MNWLIVVAGGRGERMDLGFNKVFAKLGNLPLLYWTLLAFEKSKVIDNIIVSASEDDLKKIKEIVKKYKFGKVKEVVKASDSRQNSTLAILKALKPRMRRGDLVGVHNGVNPFVREDEIRKVYENASVYGAALLAQAAKDTIKIVDKRGLVAKTPPRQYSWYAQTPQVATFANLWKAYLAAEAENFIGTDDAQLLERIGIKPKIVPCSNQNFKITFKEDLVMARHVLQNWGYNGD
ncbi:2-C-methyl-D-erythritol 4-phosphate cytidylyltransferase [Candidatus Curtissbacteria bacterium]|nr:2-C-methyl-D-erythritol 4-phosphate cytidylyltransferase [Candidatus Curtissbacteria bacterium]